VGGEPITTKNFVINTVTIIINIVMLLLLLLLLPTIVTCSALYRDIPGENLSRFLRFLENLHENVNKDLF